MNDEMIRMIRLAGEGFHCSQILLFMGLEAQGKTNPDLIRAMAGLAGGLGFSGDTCGALTGASCLLGLYAGRGSVAEEEDPRLNIMIADLVDWFSETFGARFGGIRCEVILDSDPQSRRTRCPALVMETYARVKRLLIENDFDLSEGKDV
ncbi:MAG: DVU_1555 family C-GCAxxG-C-C protein [Syntrophobacteraceae bacterium]